MERVLVDTIRERWPMIVGANTPGGLSAKDALERENDLRDDDEFGAVLTDLDLESFKEILSLKSEQEEVGDFTFSFNQSDICLAVVQWINKVSCRS